MSPARRSLACLLVALGALVVGVGPTWAHARFTGSTPSPGASDIQEDIAAVVLRFDEPVVVLDGSQVTVVDGRGGTVDAGAARTASGDPRRVVVPLRGPLRPDSFTVRFHLVSDDAHVQDGAFAFAVGDAPVRAPLATESGGLSDTGPVAVVARAVEFAAFGLLLGLIVFRTLVWGPAAAACPAGGAERDRALRTGQRWFWCGLWGLVVLAGIAETAVLAAKTAVVFHLGIGSVVLHPDLAYRLVASSRFGDLLGWRDAVLLALVCVAFATWSAERDRAPSAGRRGPSILMALLATATLVLIAAQGHASQAPLAPLSVAADAAHLAAGAIWIGGLPWLAAVLLRAPRALPLAGRALAASALARFSRVALCTAGVLAVTGLVRLAGELASPDQLWSTSYGRWLVLKIALLLPLLVLADRNRRAVRTVGGPRISGDGPLRIVARSVQLELAIAIAIVGVAALLVAEIPGRG